jgi:hypothetical protein
VVISLLPGDSSADQRPRYQLCKNRLAELLNLPSADVERLVPQDREYWIYHASAGRDWEGFEGFIKNREEIDRLASGVGEGAAESRQAPITRP